MKPGQNVWEQQRALSQHLDKQIEMPSGTKTTAGELFAAGAYVELQRAIARHRKPAEHPK